MQTLLLKTGAKIALIGPNGCGKSTLVKMIMENHDGIKISQTAKIGYFSQNLNILKGNLSIIENVMEKVYIPRNLQDYFLADCFLEENQSIKK